jgi:hypothetical protein
VRQLVNKNFDSIKMHGTTVKINGSCLYLCYINQQGDVITKLLCSKLRIAPVKKITPPTLELCGSLLVVQQIQKTVPALSLKIARILLWTDPMLGLS